MLKVQKVVKVLLLFPFSFSLFTVSAQQKSLFKTDAATGVQYRFVKHNKEGIKAHDTDFAKVLLVYVNEKDSVLFNSRIRGGDSAGNVIIPLKKTFKGCLEQGILMMDKGDSAVFRINADSLFLKTFHLPPNRIPPSITSSTFYTFYIKLNKIATKKELMDEKQEAMIKEQAKVQMRKAQEPKDIGAYLAKNYPNAKPNADSLFILSETQGNGKQIMAGDSVEMGYIGSLLDGTIFDHSNPNRGSAFKFVYTPGMGLIQGWLKLLPTLHEGDKLKVLIPSSMAYGPHGSGPKIPGYTPLIFDLEVLHVGGSNGH